MASAIKKILSGNGNLIQIVTGKDGGRDAWHCVLVSKSELQNFMDSVNGVDTVSVDRFGKIVKSGWGAGPSEEVLKELAEEYM